MPYPIWEYNYLHFQASPLTIEDWDTLGHYLKGFLLTDLKYIDDLQTRLEMSAFIQMRDYGIDEIRLYIDRKDVRNKLVELLFRNEKKFKKEYIKAFMEDPEAYDFMKEALKESGIKFVEEVKDENPQITNPSAESESKP